MAEHYDLLFELGTEELPPKTLLNLSGALLENVKNGLQRADLAFKQGKAFATPRRLALVITELNAAQADKIVQKRGPALQAAFNDDGTPSNAAQGFAKSCNTTFEQLERLKNDKGEWLAFNQQIKGQKTEILIPDIIRKSIADLPIAKRMRWGSFTAEFVRPVHWVVLLYGEKIIATRLFDIAAGNQTYGHRFHAPQQIALANAKEYEEKLREQGKVVADFESRKNLIRQLAENAANDISGTVYIDEDLLEEITALNEWPVPIVGQFDPQFLELPAEVLMTTMQSNQKYFPVFSDSGQLLPYFVTISNISSRSPDSIRKGNERVIKPRLADADFFWKQDRKRTLAERAADLSEIIFQKKLGTLADKTDRLVRLAEKIADALDIDAAASKRAALLSKADLLTEMVGEFPSLQGTMGRYYAQAEGESEEVALALEEQYFPKQSGSVTPTGRCGQILAVADKIDTLGGIFSAGLIPTGDKDPYALRRAAIGLLRIVIENKLDLDLSHLLQTSLKQFPHEFNFDRTFSQVMDFIFERLRGYCSDLGYTADEFEAVMSVSPTKPVDFILRLQAVREFRTLPEAESLSSANKRINNILKKSETQPAYDFTLLEDVEEKSLLDAANQSAQRIEPLLQAQDYQGALEQLAQLRTSVDAFFDNVMVMVEDPALRASRLGLLAMLAGQFRQIADISKLQS